MATGVRTRAAASMQTAALWMVIFVFLQHVGIQSHRTAAAQTNGHVTVNILRYLAVANSYFYSNFAGRVDFTNSAEICRLSGGVLTADQTLAAHESIKTALLSVALEGKEALTYMGGDAMYSTNHETNPSKKCVRTVEGASLNCVYQWNLGLFASDSMDHLGVSFYRGSHYTVVGHGPMNGYLAHWPSAYPANAQPFLITRIMANDRENSVWYDGYGAAGGNVDLDARNYAVVCEIQEGFVIDTTTTAAPTEAPTAVQKHWYAIFVPLAVLAAAAITALIVLCCLTRNDDDKMITPMILREVDGGAFSGVYENEGVGPSMRDMHHMMNTGSCIMSAYTEAEEFTPVYVMSSTENLVTEHGDVFK